MAVAASPATAQVLAHGPSVVLNRCWLARQINAQYEFDAALQTELELRFAALAKGETQVTLEPATSNSPAVDAAQALARRPLARKRARPRRATMPDEADASKPPLRIKKRGSL